MGLADSPASFCFFYCWVFIACSYLVDRGFWHRLPGIFFLRWIRSFPEVDPKKHSTARSRAVLKKSTFVLVGVPHKKALKRSCGYWCSLYCARDYGSVCFIVRGTRVQPSQTTTTASLQCKSQITLPITGAPEAPLQCDGIMLPRLYPHH